MSPVNDDLVVLEPIDDMAGGVARRLQNLGGEGADPRVIAFAQRVSSVAMRAASLAGPATRSLGKRRPQPGNALDVIEMVMGDEKIGQLPALRRGGGDDGIRVGRVDRRRRARARIVNEDAVIVLEAEKLMNVRRHVRPSLARAEPPGLHLRRGADWSKFAGACR